MKFYQSYFNEENLLYAHLSSNECDEVDVVLPFGTFIPAFLLTKVFIRLNVDLVGFNQMIQGLNS